MKNLLQNLKNELPFPMTQDEISKIIRMAWEDRTTFEDIYKRTGLTEAEVIKIMRANLKLKSFRLWRKRVSGRTTKHGKKFRRELTAQKSGRRAIRAHEVED